MTPQDEWVAIMYGPNDEDPALVAALYAQPPDNQDQSDFADALRRMRLSTTGYRY